MAAGPRDGNGCIEKQISKSSKIIKMNLIIKFKRDIKAINTLTPEAFSGSHTHTELDFKSPPT